MRDFPLIFKKIKKLCKSLENVDSQEAYQQHQREHFTELYKICILYNSASRKTDVKKEPLIHLPPRLYFCGRL